MLSRSAVLGRISIGNDLYIHLCGKAIDNWLCVSTFRKQQLILRFCTQKMLFRLIKELSKAMLIITSLFTSSLKKKTEEQHDGLCEDLNICF